MDRDEFDRAAFGIDVVLFPFFGVVFAAFSCIPLLIGSFRLNGELVTFADQPLKFVGVVAVEMLIGSALCFYGWL